MIYVSRLIYVEADCIEADDSGSLKAPTHCWTPRHLTGFNKCVQVFHIGRSREVMQMLTRVIPSPDIDGSAEHSALSIASIAPDREPRVPPIRVRLLLSFCTRSVHASE